ncbi:Uma2 family endonuclease, partial [bacterium]
MAVSAPSPLRWSREAFYALCETGLLGDQRVELIEGEIIEMPPPGPRHVKLVRFLFRLMSSLAPEGTFVAKEDPFDLPRTVVVPDVLVLKGDLWSYDELNPS